MTNTQWQRGDPLPASPPDRLGLSEQVWAELLKAEQRGPSSHLMQGPTFAAVMAALRRCADQHDVQKANP